MWLQSPFYVLVMIQIFISGSQSKPQATTSKDSDPEFCQYLNDDKCQEETIKEQCINRCKPTLTDAEFCIHITKDKCAEDYIRTECSQKCNRPARDHKICQYVHEDKCDEEVIRIQCSQMCSRPAIDEWLPWSDWGKCSALCGDGVRQRTRICTSPSSSRSAQKCDGNAIETEICNNGQCPQNGGWSGWSAWGSCSASCGTGSRTRSRECSSPTPAFGGQPCKGQNIQQEDCNNQPCRKITSGGECPGPWVRVGQECFLIIHERSQWRNWTAARAYCRSQAPGADLAQPADLQGLRRFMVANGYPDRYIGYYLGGSDSAVEGTWRWINGSVLPTDHDDWNPGEPNEAGYDCLGMRPDWGAKTLGDLHCDWTRRFICDRP